MDGWDGNHRLASVLRGNDLILTVFRGVDPAIELFAVDVRTGIRRWNAQLAKTSIWERKPFYQNLVTLELVQDSVVVTIDQPLGLSVQLFDAGNGKLWWSRQENWK